jgi:hypothetical protein
MNNIINETFTKHLGLVQQHLKLVTEEEYDSWRDSWLDSGGSGKPPTSWSGGSHSYGKTAKSGGAASMSGKTLYFYNVPSGKDAEATGSGLRRTKSGKWYAFQPMDAATKAFGSPRAWSPKNEASVVGEEASMAAGDLDRIEHYTKHLKQLVNDDSELEDWVKAKLTLASSNLESVFGYLNHNNKSDGDDNKQIDDTAV